MPERRLRLIQGRPDAAAEHALLGRQVREALAGDRAAEAGLVRRFYPSTVSMAFRLLGEREQARDIAQEVFVVFARHLHRIEEPERIAGWLRSITVNLCRKHIRSRQRYRARFVPLDPVDIDAHFETDEERPELRLSLERLYAALHELKPDQRLALVLKDIEGMTWPEMEEATGRSVSTLKRRHREAHRRLQQKVEVPRG